MVLRALFVVWCQYVPSPDLVDTSLSTFKCGSTKFLAPDRTDRGAQAALAGQVEAWSAAIQTDETIKQRDSGLAAIAIWETISIDLKAVGPYITWDGVASRWALFTRSDAGELVMQAMALVDHVAATNTATVVGIVSRRSLLRDELAVRGAGKALLGRIIEEVGAAHPEMPVTIFGAPGDDFVDQMYRAHGMVEVGKYPDGRAKLQMEIPAKCTDFMRSAILCREMDALDYAAIAWRLVPNSEVLFETCAHVLPDDLYKEQIGKVFGLVEVGAEPRVRTERRLAELTDGLAEVPLDSRQENVRRVQVRA